MNLELLGEGPEVSTRALTFIPPLEVPVFVSSSLINDLLSMHVHTVLVKLTRDPNNSRYTLRDQREFF